MKQKLQNSFWTKLKNVSLSAKNMAHVISRLTFSLIFVQILKGKVINFHFKKYFPSFFSARVINSVWPKLTCSCGPLYS